MARQADGKRSRHDYSGLRDSHLAALFPTETAFGDLDTMSTTHRRLIALLILTGGPVAGWLLNGDRGILFGLIASALAVVWLLIEERKLM